MGNRIPTDIRSLRDALASISGTKVMIIEECPTSRWLYCNLHLYVEAFVLCDPRRNRAIYDDGDKADAVDSADLAALYRGGYVHEVDPTASEGRLALKEIASLYHDRVRDAGRQICPATTALR